MAGTARERSKPLTVLTHAGGDIAARIAAAVPGVAVVEVAAHGEPAPEVTGEVLLTFGWGAPNLEVVLARGVRWVHTMATGVDRFPLDVVGERVLTCARGASAAPISEWVLAVMLAFEKRLPESWVHAPPEHWHWAELGTLQGRTLGLVGLGGIGAAVADRGLAFGMDVVAHRRTTRPAHRPEIRLVSSLGEVLEVSDHLVLCLPATTETRGLLDAAAFARVKPGVHLVNVSRGTLVDADALRIALDNGRVARASLDTVDPEPLPVDHWMYTHPGIRLSPHISWSRPAAGDAIVECFVENLRRYLAGEPLEGIVDLAAGY